MFPCDGAEGFTSFTGIDHTCMKLSEKLSNSLFVKIQAFK